LGQSGRWGGGWGGRWGGGRGGGARTYLHPPPRRLRPRGKPPGGGLGQWRC
jgi:hypothetical protein